MFYYYDTTNDDDALLLEVTLARFIFSPPTFGTQFSRHVYVRQRIKCIYYLAKLLATLYVVSSTSRITQKCQKRHRVMLGHPRKGLPKSIFLFCDSNKSTVLKILSAHISLFNFSSDISRSLKYSFHIHPPPKKTNEFIYWHYIAHKP